MLGLALPEGRFSLSEINTLLAVYESATLRFLIQEKEELMSLAHEIVRLAEELPIDRVVLMNALMECYQSDQQNK